MYLFEIEKFLRQDRAEIQGEDMKKMTKKQRDIILAACREFEEYGFAGTGMEQILSLIHI